MLKVYGIPNCNTVKKAREWLSARGIAYEFHDFKKQGAPENLLRDWLKQQPWEKLVNRAGMTWRNLSGAEKNTVTDNASAIQLMMAKPSVIKRPIVMQADEMVALGFTEADYQKVFK